jgi:enhancer of mRNA-decapping protein 3
MVLDTGEPMDLQQIQIPLMSTNTSKRYVTDDGVILPCIDYDLRKRLFDQSYKHGFSKERQIECMGRCCAEMALQLVGGPLRFSPKNNHQKPSILVLANSQDLQGAYALCSARLLSNRSCKIYLYITKSMNNEINEHFETELKLFRSIDLPSNTYLNSVDDIKNLNSIDLIINGLDSSVVTSQSVWYKNLVRCIEQCKASVLSIDPCSEGSTMSSKWCLVPVLPLEMSPKCGRVYLCDLGFTKNMFQSVNIKYRSPFGAKFLIPLHDD